MILLIGGLGAGKRDYVEHALGYQAGDMSTNPMDGKPVLLDLHECIRAEGGFREEWLDALRVKAVVVCAEVGCGVVPMDRGERIWREQVGRACTRLAADADAVVRLVCGLPQAIKGELP